MGFTLQTMCKKDLKGSFLVSKTWARKFMLAKGFANNASTTSRKTSPEVRIARSGLAVVSR